MLTRSQVIAQVYAEWERDWVGRTTPDPAYAHDAQYTEGMVAMSAGPEADDDLQRRVVEALTAAGLPVEWDG